MKFSSLGVVVLHVPDRGIDRTGRRISRRWRPDRAAGRLGTERGFADQSARGLPLRSAPRTKVLSDQSRRSPFQLPFASRRRGTAGEHQLQHLPRQRGRQPQALHSQNVDPAGQFRHHRPAVQSDGRQPCTGSRAGPVAARGSLPRAIWNRWPHRLTSRIRPQRHRQRVRGSGADPGDRRGHRRLHRRHRFSAKSKSRSGRAADAGGDGKRTPRRSAVRKAVSTRSEHELRELSRAFRRLRRSPAA